MPSLSTMILQVAVILAAARSVGWLFRRLGQPQVIGEMTAGILLGPSFLGWLAPAAAARLFPPDSLGFLAALSQVGLLLYMFLVGIEFDVRQLRGRGHTAVVTSHVSILAPFVLGAALSLYLYDRLSQDSVSLMAFVLFMGSAMSVTAFPVLARILGERGLIRTRLGALAIACAAVNDVTAWSILAIVLAIVRSSAAAHPLWVTLGGSAAYMLVMLFVVRPAARRFAPWYRNRGRLTPDITAAALFLLLLSAWTTEWLGIHALFGAFLAGAVMPKEARLVEDLTDRIEHVTLLLLLPLFFAFTGLQTRIGLLSGAEMWLYFGAIVLIAVAGKFGGSAIAARVTGLSWREAGALGILMNTRGLMELVILSVGFELGVISPTVFTMMVLMALVTTLMTTPMLRLIYPSRLLQPAGSPEDVEKRDFTILIPVSLPASGPRLLDVARMLTPAQRPLRCYALFLEPDTGQTLSAARRHQRVREDTLSPILRAADAEGLAVHPVSFVTTDVGRDIVEVAHAKHANVILMGWHKPIIATSILSGTVREVMRNAGTDVAVYVERGRRPWGRILVPYRGGPHDRYALELARRATQSGAEVTVLHVMAPDADGAEDPVLRDESAALSGGAGLTLKVVHSEDPVGAVIREAQQAYDVTIVGIAAEWGLSPGGVARDERLVREARTSLLVVRSYARASADVAFPDAMGTPAAGAPTT
ncbi:MAG: cation:proton antiporter [Gemmatimonadetes bacterium]|nr:cation:proton antiporter [Gemmatimonadota bacterium]